MIKAKELKEWANALDDDSVIGIEDYMLVGRKADSKGWEEELKVGYLPACDDEPKAWVAIQDFIDFLEREQIPATCRMSFSEDSAYDNLYALSFDCDTEGVANKVATYFGCPDYELPDGIGAFTNSDYWVGEGNFRDLGDELTEFYGEFFDIVRITIADLKSILKKAQS